VPRYPYVEDGGLALAHEVLNLRVERDASVHVEALLQFQSRGPGKNRVVTFPIAGPRGACRQFRAWALGRAARPVVVARGQAGVLPMGQVVESWDLWLHAADFEQSGSWLAVRYVQPGTGDFAYVLRSGAYWHGPIRTLRVVVRDPHGRLSAVSVEDRRVPTRGAAETTIELTDVEPENGVRLVLR
jgi:hypothetical protein